MNKIMGCLGQIEDLLEQIENITQNQATILLHQLEDEEDDSLSCMEQMLSIKDEVMNELSQIETAFQHGYEQHKEQLIASGLIKEVKTHVAKILETKDRIMKQEQNNLRILTSRAGSKPEKVEIRPSAQSVAMAYKQNQSKF